MKKFDHVAAKIADWHFDRNLIKGATDWSQSEKLLEEFIELIASQMPDAEACQISEVVVNMTGALLRKGRIKSVSASSAESAKLDAIGDMTVVLINIAERNNSSLETCMNLAYNEIKDRKGTMKNGMYIKESDL